MGVEQANILEPSCGTGNFLGMLPQEMQSSKLYGVAIKWYIMVSSENEKDTKTFFSVWEVTKR